MKKEAFRWSPDATDAFGVLKQALTMGPVLQLPDFSQEFVIHCDTSDELALARSSIRAMAYCRIVAPQHAKLVAYERKLIGLVHAVRHWRPYLF